MFMETRRFGLLRRAVVLLLTVAMLVTSFPTSAHAGQSSAGYVWPLRSAGTITQNYSADGHGGTDIAISKGNDVLAAADGTVKFVQSWNGSTAEGSMQSYGNLVIIYHPGKGTTTYYAHLNDYTVRQGQTVKQGDVIGHSGNTGRVFGSNGGYHLHFELRTGATAALGNTGTGSRVNPLDYVSQSNLYDGSTPLGSEMTTGYDRVLPDGDYAIVLTSTMGSDTHYFLDIAGTECPAGNSGNVSVCGSSEYPTELDEWDLWHIEYSDGFYTITQKGTNVALGVYGGLLERGSNVDVWEDNGHSARRWAISRSGDGFRLQCKCNGWSLDNEGGRLADGNNVRVYEFGEGTGQQTWSFIRVCTETTTGYDRVLPDGDYAIVLTDTLDSPTKYFLDIPGTEYPAGNSGNVTVCGTAGDPAELDECDLWHVEYANGFYTITQRGTSMALGVNGGGSYLGANVDVWTDHDHPARRWAITKSGDAYRLYSKCNGWALDNQTGILTTGNNVDVWAPGEGVGQQTWSFIPVNRNISRATSWLDTNTPEGAQYRTVPFDYDYGLTYFGKELVAGTDYTVEFSDNVYPGTATVTYTGIGDYTGTKVVTFEITKRTIEEGIECAHLYSIADQTFTGSAITPDVNLGLLISGAIHPRLAEGTDYELAWADNVNVGTATVTATGIGYFYGANSATFQIVPADIATAAIDAVPDQVATGSAVRPAISARLGEYELTEGVDYDLSYADNTAPGTATVTITGKGNFSGTCTATFKIVEASTPGPAAERVEMHRLYNRWTGEHFYTASAGERDGLVKVGWTYEGVGWVAPSVSNTPVYRLFNPYAAGGDHHYTTDEAEYEYLQSVGWRGEGIGWYGLR